MATQRASSNIFWSTITSLVAGELVTKARLYTEALHRLQDNDGALLGRIARVYSDLVSEAVGTKARIVGNIDMTAFNYDGGVALSGLTVIVDENTTTAQTCTFTNAVTGPDVLLSQLTASCGTNLIWSLNDSGQLVCECQTIGGTSTIAIGAGTAHSTIWPSPTITTPGAGTANDGTSRIGFGATGAWAGGTLRSFLTTVETAVANALLKSGGTMTGSITFTSPAKVVYNAAIARSARGVWTFPSTNTDWQMTSMGVPLHANTAQSVVSIDYDLDVIPGDVLDGVEVWSYHDGTPHGGLPGTMPSIRVWKWPHNATTPTALGAAAVTDPSASTAEYEAMHAVTITGLAETIVAKTRYFVRYSSEDGANDEPGRYLTGVIINGTSNGLPPGA
ncbi:MAG: hypothetical protein E6Q97_21915 [Desulfurellales bacterium]|nr:MAG: hypothetical protein E6Q97_21915 [Desulfurellales bacterium]